MKNIIKPAIVTALMLLLSRSTYAASIGASFLGDSGVASQDTSTVEPWSLAPSAAAGVVVQSNWNNIFCYNWGNVAPAPGVVGNSGPLLDSAGNLTAVELQFSADDAWNSDGTFLDTPNDMLMKGILKEGYGIGATMFLTFTNLAPGSYDVYVYGAVNSGPAELAVSIGGTTNYWEEPAVFEDVADGGGGFAQAAASNEATNPAAGNYVLFTGVTPVSGAITITATYDDPTNGAGSELGIAGLQLVTSGSFPPNTTPVSIERQPGPGLAAPGGTATFQVLVTGPFPHYQWLTNGAAIPGATSSSYTTPPVSTNNNGAQYQVTISNNVNSVTSEVVVLTVMPDPGTRVASIGASFLGDNTGGNVEPWTLARSAAAGVVVQSNWNNISTTATGDVGISGLLLEGAGLPSAVQLEFNANDAWNTGSLVDTPNDKLMMGTLKEGYAVGASMFLTFTNLALAFYDVYVYGDVNGGPAELAVSVGGTATNYWEEPAAFTDLSDPGGTGFIEAASYDSNNPAAGNYVKFTGVTPVSGTITITATYDDQSGGGNDELGIAGVQILSSVSFPANTLPVVITGQPGPGLATPGGRATFLVGAAGPFPNYQWLTNGAAIPGATSSSYTTPPVSTNDNGALYRVIVSNNVNSVTSEVVVLTVMPDPGTRVASMGASFLGNSTNGDVEPWTLAPSDAAGVVVQSNWNNISTTATGDRGISSILLEGTGILSAVQLEFIANDATNAGSLVDTPNDKLMMGILKESGGIGASMYLTFTNLAPGFYDVYVYGNVDSGPAELAVSVGGTTNYWEEPAAFTDVSDGGAGFIQSASSEATNPAAGNYVKFTGVTPASGAITITATYDDASGGGNGELGIAGVQILSSVSFATNTLPVVITGEPRPAIAAPGGTATFLVLATGPLPHYQWLTNGAAIPGATSSSYTTPPLSTNDNGAQYQVLVSNNVNSVMSDVVVLTVMADPGTRVASMGASFLGESGIPAPWSLAPSAAAGVVVQSNWNNIYCYNWGNAAPAPGTVGRSGPLLDSAGNPSAVQLLFIADDAWYSDGTFLDTPNDKLMMGILKEGYAIGASMYLTFSNLAPAFYDVYVYGDVNGGPAELAVSVGGTATNYWEEPAAFADLSDPGGTGFILAASNEATNPAAGNYVQFTGVTPVSGTLTITATYDDPSGGGGTELGIAGVQIVSSASFPSLATLVPELTGALESGKIVIAWNSPADFQLQYRSDLRQGSWADQTTPPVVIGSTHTITLPATGAASFFRLVGR